MYPDVARQCAPPPPPGQVRSGQDRSGVPGIFSEMPRYTLGIFWLGKYVPLVYGVIKVILLQKYNIYAFKLYF